MRDFIIYETDYWKVILADNQSLLGRCIIDLKRNCETMSELTFEEWRDFHENIVIPLERSIRKSFGAKMFNWMCFMNNAYKRKTNAQVHFYLLPRYEDKVLFEGEEFLDEQFGEYYKNNNKKEVSDELFKKILEQIRKNS